MPVRLTGDLNNPDITPLDPAAIGQNLLGIMRSILALPFKVLDPLLHLPAAVNLDYRLTRRPSRARL